jgi:hypothetical protein
VRREGPEQRDLCTTMTVDGAILVPPIVVPRAREKVLPELGPAGFLHEQPIHQPGVDPPSARRRRMEPLMAPSHRWCCSVVQCGECLA